MSTSILNKRITGKIFIFILLISCNIFSQTKTFTAAQNNNWNNSANWNPAGVPSLSDAVIIPAGRTCSVDSNAVCASLTFQNGAASSLSIQWGFKSLTVAGSVTINNSTDLNIGIISSMTVNGAIINNGSVVIDSDLGWLSIKGGIINNGSFSTSGFIFYHFTDDQAISGTALNLSGSITVADSVTLTNNTNLVIRGNLNGNGSTSRFINNPGATVNITGTLFSTGILDLSAADNYIIYAGNDQTLKETAYQNLTLSGSGTKLLPHSVSAFTINGNLTIENGTTLNGNNRIISIKGNLVNNGLYSNANTVIFNGTSVQTIGGTVSTVFDTLIINNPAGLDLAKSQSVNDLLILTAGKISTSSANLLTITASGSISGGSISSFVNGPLARTKNTAAQQTLSYPIGKSNSFRPIELILTHTNANSSVYTAEVFNSAPAPRTIPGTLGSVSSVRYWNVAKTGTAVVSAAYITLNYGIDDGVAEPEDLRIAKQNGTAWTDIGGTANGFPEGSILSTFFTTFSDFVLANRVGGANPLPVELSSFTASSGNNEVILKWSTKTEMQNYGFEIEKCKKNEYTWENIGFVKGSGNSNSPKEYSFRDRNLNSGIYIFRLKQVDTDGSFQYSGEVEVSVNTIAGSCLLEQNYPNPFNPSTTIKFMVKETGIVTVKVYDVLGKEVETLFNEMAEGGKYQSIQFNGSDYASGVYYYAITANDYSEVKKMTLIK